MAERDLDDLLQDVMLAAYRGLDGFDPSRGGRVAQRDPAAAPVTPTAGAADALRRWLFGIAWRQVGHYRGRAYRRREVAVGAGSSWPCHLADPGPSSEQLLMREQRSTMVSRILTTIDIDRRVILIMYDLLDTPMAEIARDLDLKENTARNRLRLAREDFRIAVKRMNAEERLALRNSSALPVAELSRVTDEEAILRAAHVVPEVPDDVRRRLWAAIERAIAEEARRPAAARLTEAQA